LAEALKSSESRTRSYVAQVLGRIGDPRAVEPLKRLVTDPDPEVRMEVRRALRKITGGGEQ
jgi:HEAT repeat protein